MHDTNKEWSKIQRCEAIVGWSIALFIVVMLGIFALTCSSSLGAPAPAPRPAPKPAAPVMVASIEWGHLQGSWMMQWGDSKWDTLLRPDGTYRCELIGGGGSEWIGHWRIDFEGRLEVTEAPLDDNGVPGVFNEWAVRWDRLANGLTSATIPSGTVVHPGGNDSVSFVLVRKLVRMKK